MRRKLSGSSGPTIIISSRSFRLAAQAVMALLSQAAMHLPTLRVTVPDIRMRMVDILMVTLMLMGTAILTRMATHTSGSDSTAGDSTVAASAVGSEAAVANQKF